MASFRYCRGLLIAGFIFSLASCGSEQEPDRYTAGGAVSGLLGSGLVLQNQLGDDLEIVDNGQFTFDSTLVEGSFYDVTVRAHPSAPKQTCTVTNGTGRVAGGDVTDVQVTCVTNEFTIGGTVGGLAGRGLILQNLQGDDLEIAENGSFSFTSPLPDGSDYSVTVSAHPRQLSQTCSVTDGVGAVTGTNVNNVAVQCITDEFMVGGLVSGLVGAGLVLQNLLGDDLGIDDNGPFSFAVQLTDGSDYSVTVLQQPMEPSQTCTVTGGTGTLEGHDIGDVHVTCVIVTDPDDSTEVPLPGFGSITGTCGFIDDELYDPNPSFALNAIDFGDTPYEQEYFDLLTPEGQQLILDGNAGGGSLLSEVFAMEVLARCELAELIATETQIVYDIEGKITDILVAINGEYVGVSVVRAVGWPRDAPYTIENATTILERKLSDILVSSANVSEQHRWVKQILHVVAYSDEHAVSIESAWEVISDDVRADTIVLVTVTNGDDAFIY